MGVKKIMGKILLCGNGININFEKRFQLIEFINLLLNEQKLRFFFSDKSNFFIPKSTKIEVFGIYSTFNVSGYHKKIDNFCWIINKCRKEISASKKHFAKNGVEVVFKQLFEKVEEYLAFDEKNNLNYKEFEATFKEIFFTYIWQLQNQTLLGISNQLNTSYLGYKNKLEDYMKIITLNYDTILEKIIPKNSRDIIHWHGVLKEKSGGTLDFSKCLLDTVRHPKSLHLFKQIPLFKNYQKYKNKFELDILGLNPMNDENVFALFINSQICNKINFYYFSLNDLKSLSLILKKIQNIFLEINKSNKVILKALDDAKRFDFFKRESKKYVIKFYNSHTSKHEKYENSLEINLISSESFWKSCKNISSQSSRMIPEIIEEF